MIADDPPLIQPEMSEFDAAKLDPSVRSLALRKMTIPRGELAKLPNLEHLYIDAIRGTELDVTGCQRLKTLEIRWARKLESIHGLAELTDLELLAIHTCSNLRELPSLAGSSALRTLDLGPLTSLSTIGPALEAPGLEELILWGAVPISASDLSAMRHHPTLRVFDWRSPAKVPKAVVDAVVDTVARSRSRRELARPHPEGRRRSGQDSSSREVADQGRLELYVNCSMATGWGGFYPMYVIGPLLVDGAPDFGSALEKIEVDVFPHQEPAGEFAEDIRRYNEFRERLPEIRFRRAHRAALIRAVTAVRPSSLFHPHKRTTIGIFRQGCIDVLAALEALRQRITPDDDFDIDGFLAYCARILDRIPETPHELDEWLAEAGERRRAVRQAIAQQHEFAGWRPGEPAPKAP